MKSESDIATPAAWIGSQFGEKTCAGWIASSDSLQARSDCSPITGSNRSAIGASTGSAVAACAADLASFEGWMSSLPMRRSSGFPAVDVGRYVEGHDA